MKLYHAFGIWLIPLLILPDVDCAGITQAFPNTTSTASQAACFVISNVVLIAVIAIWLMTGALKVLIGQSLARLSAKVAVDHVHKEADAIEDVTVRSGNHRRKTRTGEIAEPLSEQKSEGLSEITKQKLRLFPRQVY